MTVKIIHGSAHDIPISDQSVHTIVTSPPYWGLRSYDGEQGVEWPTVSYAPMPGLPEMTIPGCDPDCEHEWADGQTVTVGRNDGGRDIGGRGGNYQDAGPHKTPVSGSYCIHCGGWRGGLGMEPTPEAFIGHMILVMRELWRVLRDDGTAWVNFGDSYNGSAPNRSGNNGYNDGRENRNKRFSVGGVDSLKPKGLCLIPARFALACQADGWYVRSDIIWAKPNPMPESTTDRPTKAHEYIWLLSKKPRYYYDADAVREPHVTFSEKSRMKGGRNHFGKAGGTPEEGKNKGSSNLHDGRWDQAFHPKGRNRRTVWTVATQPYSDAHFATYPAKLIEPCILAGTSAHGVCAACGAPWERVVEKSRATHPATEDPTLLTGRKGMNRTRHGDTDTYVLGVTQPVLAQRLRDAGKGREAELRDVFGSKWDHWIRTDKSGARVPTFADASVIEDMLGITIPFDGEATGWRPTCTCDADIIPATVLDPFHGSGTTGQVAIKHRRNYIGVDISAEYIENHDRIGGTQVQLL